MNPQNIPKNKEVLQTLDSVRETLADTKNNKNIDSHGQKIIEKADEVVADVAQLVKKKNPNDTMQKIMKESQKLYDDMIGSEQKWQELKKSFNTEKEFEQFTEKLKNIRDNIKILSVELVRSSEFRRDVSDLFWLFYTFLLEQAKDEIEKLQQQLPNQGSLQVTPTSTTSTTSTPAPPGSESSNWKEEDISKQQIVDKFNEIMKNISSRKRGYETFTQMKELFEIFKGPVEKVAEKASKKAKETKLDIQSNPHFKKIVTLSEDLFSAITNYNPEKIISLCKDMYTSIVEDEHIEQFLKDFTNFIDEQLQNPQQIGREESIQKLEQFYERGRKLTKDKKDIQKKAQKLKEEFNKMIDKINNDDIFNELQSDIKDMISLLVLDNSGNLTFKPEMVQQLKNILLITLIQKLKLPLPGIVYKGESLSFKIKGIMVNLQEILPDTIIAEHSGRALIDLTQVEKKGELPDINKARETISIKMTNINVKIPSAEIEFSRNTFPAFDDNGYVDIKVGGRGMDLIISVYVDMNMKEDRLFELNRIECNCHDLQITLKDTAHDTLYNTLVSMFNSSFKQNIENTVEEVIAQMLKNLNKQILSQREYLMQSIQQGVEIARTGLKKTPEWKEKTF